MHKGERVSVCGTRATIRVGAYDYRVVCATCGEGGSVRYEKQEWACRVMTRDSGKPCRYCGAH